MGGGGARRGGKRKAGREVVGGGGAGNERKKRVVPNFRIRPSADIGDCHICTYVIINRPLTANSTYV